MSKKDDFEEFGKYEMADEYDSIYDIHQVDMGDEMVNGCYDEYGNRATCDLCGSNLYWRNGNYICPDCGREFGRADFFISIGANPPDEKCITCYENYPVCKSWCDQVEVKPDDEFYF